MTRRILSPFVLAPVLGLAVFGWFLFPSSKPVTEASEPPKAQTVLPVTATVLSKQSTFQKKRNFSGIVKARRQSALSFELAGKVTECLVDEGDVVKPKQPLAKIEADRLLVQQQQAKAKLAQAKSKLEELVAGPRKQTIESMRGQVDELAALRDLALRKKERSDRLHKSGAITDQDRDQFYFDYLSRESRYLSFKQQLAELEDGTRVEQIAAQKATVQELDATLKSINIDLHDTILKAPFAGTIVKREIDEGEVVNAGQSVFELIEDRVLEIWVGVPVEATASILQQTEFDLTIGNRQFKVKRQKILPQLNRQTRTQSVLFHFADEQPPTHVYTGQVARLHFSEEVQQEGFWIPSDALIKGVRGLWSCYTLAPVDAESTSTEKVYELERRDVEELYTRDGYVYVTGTIREGDLLLSKGAHRVVSGQRVRLGAEAKPNSTSPLPNSEMKGE